MIECNLSRLASINFLFAFILADTTVSLWPELRNTEWEVLIRTHSLLRNVRHRAWQPHLALCILGSFILVGESNVSSKLRACVAAQLLRSICAVAAMLANNAQLQQKLWFSAPACFFRAALLKIGGNIAGDPELLNNLSLVWNYSRMVTVHSLEVESNALSMQIYRFKKD